MVEIIGLQPLCTLFAIGGCVLFRPGIPFCKPGKKVRDIEGEGCPVTLQLFRQFEEKKRRFIFSFKEGFEYIVPLGKIGRELTGITGSRSGLYPVGFIYK